MTDENFYIIKQALVTEIHDAEVCCWFTFAFLLLLILPALITFLIIVYSDVVSFIVSISISLMVWFVITAFITVSFCTYIEEKELELKEFEDKYK